MSKRAEAAAMKAYPQKDALNKKATGHYDANYPRRKAYQQGYEQAEKDTIERAVEWLKVHAEDYIVNMTGSYPDAPFNAIIGGKCWDELKKAMEEE